MFRYVAVTAGLVLAALAVFHPAPRPPQLLAGTATTVAAPVSPAAASGSHRTRRRRRRPPGAGRCRPSRRNRRHTSRRHAFSGTVSVNRDDGTLLGRVPGIGPALASRIVELRQTEGSYTSLDQLLDVAGMSVSRLERARPYLTL